MTSNISRTDKQKTKKIFNSQPNTRRERPKLIDDVVSRPRYAILKMARNEREGKVNKVFARVFLCFMSLGSLRRRSLSV
jgi:hypothetical protein